MRTFRAILAAIVVTASVCILVGVSVLAIINGLEWAILSILGVPAKAIYIIMAISSLPAVVWLAKFAIGAWRSLKLPHQMA
jgi:ABC-type antimicrobial peptide transport system permease subunit